MCRIRMYFKRSEVAKLLKLCINSCISAFGGVFGVGEKLRPLLSIS